MKVVNIINYCNVLITKIIYKRANLLILLKIKNDKFFVTLILLTSVLELERPRADGVGFHFFCFIHFNVPFYFIKQGTLETHSLGMSTFKRRICILYLFISSNLMVVFLRKWLSMTTIETVPIIF